MSTSGWKVCWGWVGKMWLLCLVSNSNASCFRVALSWVELSYVGFSQLSLTTKDSLEVCKISLNSLVTAYIYNEISNTSLARSATLGDTSWARLTTELTSSLINVFLLQGLLLKLCLLLGQRNAKIYAKRTSKGSYHENPIPLVEGGWMIPSGNKATPWLHLASWNLLDSQLWQKTIFE